MTRRSKSNSRRVFLGQATGVAALVAISGATGYRPAEAAGHLPKLDPTKYPQALALGYVHESVTEGQLCSNCQFFKGGTAAWGECQIFPGQEVNAKGWCKTWVKKAS